MATEIEIEIVEQATQVVEIVSAGPQGPAGKDGALSPEIPIIITGGFF